MSFEFIDMIIIGNCINYSSIINSIYKKIVKERYNNNSKIKIYFIKSDPLIIKEDYQDEITFNNNENIKEHHFEINHPELKIINDDINFLVKKSLQEGIQVSEIKESIKLIVDKNNHSEIHLKNGTQIYAKKIVYLNKEFDEKEGNDNIRKSLIQNLFPSFQEIKDFPYNSRIAIIGTSHTAIEAALMLNHLGHKGKISLISKSGLLPEIKGNYYRLEKPKTAVYKTFERMFQEKGTSLTIRDILKVIRSEIKTYNYDWRKVFSKKCLKLESYDSLEKRIEKAKIGPTIFNIALGIVSEIEKSYKFVSKEEICHLKNAIANFTLAKREAISLKRAEALLNMLKTEQLDIRGNIQDIRYHASKFEIIFEKGHHVHFDCIINFISNYNIFEYDKNYMKTTHKMAQEDNKKVNLSFPFFDIGLDNVKKAQTKLENPVINSDYVSKCYQNQNESR